MMNIFGASVWGESVWMIYLLAGYAIRKGCMKKIQTIPLLAFGMIIPFGIMYAIEFTGTASSTMISSWLSFSPLRPSSY